MFGNCRPPRRAWSGPSPTSSRGAPGHARPDDPGGARRCDDVAAGHRVPGLLGRGGARVGGGERGDPGAPPPLGAYVSAADYSLACLLLVLAPLVLVPGERFGTWIAYQPGYALSVIITASGVRSLTLWAGGMFGIVACYAVYLGGSLDGEMTTTAIGNILTYVVYALVTRMFFGYTRRIAHDADESRARAAELARREEERRAQVMMHNGVAVMRLLTEPGTDAVRSRLLGLAEVEVQRMRSYLRGRSPDRNGEGSDVGLAALITRVCERFADLPVETLLDLGAAVRMPAGRAEAVERALESLLLNVREHARADAVVIHLDADVDAGWTLTVRDDGVGFDAVTAVPGVGLREVVVGELRRWGIGVDVESAAGAGTTVTISAGPAPAAVGAGRDTRTDAG
ncbi:sensor histidine kinase [Catellatospora coxensis]